MKKITCSLILLISIFFGQTGCKSDSANESILTLTTENFGDEISKGVVMVDFWASWCMPCKAMTPVIEEIASQTRGKIKVGKVDIDANGQLANQFEIQAIPTIIIFKDGKAVETLVGIQSKVALVNALSKHVTLQ
jgi:thioredoxin 1